MSRKSTACVPSPKTSNNCIGNEDGWTDETTKDLLQKMKQAIPKPDVSKYKTQLEKFEWSKLQVGSFSSDDCKKQWLRICKKLRKYKTLSDLVEDSLEYVENPYKGNIKKHPDHPKRPLTPYFRFFLSEREKFAASHKEMSNLEITNVLSKKYRAISNEEKDRYMDEWKREMVEYRAKLEQFKKDHPEYYDKSPPRMSRTPLQIFNQEHAPAIASGKEQLSKKEIDEGLRKKYHNLEDDQKLPYILKAIEEQEKYKEEFDMYKKAHPAFVPTTAQTKCPLTLADWRIHDKSLGKPDRPPANGYNLFCTRMMVSEEMKHLSSRERIMQCGQKWKFLTDEEKNEYQTEFIQLRDHYRSAMKNFMKSLPALKKEEFLERKKEYEAKKGSKRKSNTQMKELMEANDEVEEEEAEEEASDSESGSSSSDSSSDDDEEDENGGRAQRHVQSAKSTSSVPLRPTTPISALFLYQKAHREKFAAKYPQSSKSDITLLLARKFNNLPQERKAKYLQKEKEQRAIYNEKMRRHIMAEQEQANNMNSLELKPITGEQVFQERNEEIFLKRASGDNEKAQVAMRKAWTQMIKEKKMKYVKIAHERNAKNIAEHQAAKVAAEEKKKKTSSQPALPPFPEERHLSQKEIKSYLSLEPRSVPKDAQQLFKNEKRPKLMHLTAPARNQEISRMWSELATSEKNAYKQKVKVGIQEYNKKLQRWIKSLPRQAHEAYQAAQKKSKASSKAAGNSATSAGTKRKADKDPEKGSKKAKISEPQSESSDDSSDDDSSTSSDSDDESSSSDDSSGAESNASGHQNNGKATENQNDDSSDDSSSSSSDDDSDSSD